MRTKTRLGRRPPALPHTPYYPVFLDLRGRRCVVIGTGVEVEGKVRVLLEAGAQVSVLTPCPSPGLLGMAQAGSIALLQRFYQKGDLRGAFLAIAATTADYPLSQRIAQEAQREGVLLNVVDTPDLCTWVAPAIVRRGALTVAVSTNGLSPSMARFVKEHLERMLPQEWGALLDLVALARREVRRRGVHPSPEVWQKALNEETLRMATAQRWEGVWERLLHHLTNGQERV